MANYEINIKGILDSATTTANLNTTLQEVSKSITFTIQNISVSQAALTSLQSQISGAISTATANVTPKTAGGTTPVSQINPVDQTGALTSLQLIQNKIAEIKASNDNHPIDVSYNNADTEKATQATLTYTNAQGLLAKQILDVNVAQQTVTEGASKAKDAQIKQITDTQAAYTKYQQDELKASNDKEMADAKADAKELATYNNDKMASLQEEANYQNKAYDNLSSLQQKAFAENDAFDQKRQSAQQQLADKQYAIDQKMAVDDENYQEKAQASAQKTIDAQMVDLEEYSAAAQSALDQTSNFKPEDLQSSGAGDLQANAQEVLATTKEYNAQLENGHMLTQEQMDNVDKLNQSVEQGVQSWKDQYEQMVINANFQNKQYDQQMLQIQRAQQQSAEAMAQTSGKNTADPTVVKYQSDAQALSTASTEIENSIKGVGPTSNEAMSALTGLSGSVRESGQAFQSANNNVKSFGDMVENDIIKVAQWFIATTVIMGAIKEIGSGIQYIQDLNKELINIEMITNTDATQVAELASQYNDLASALGATTLEVTQSAEVWLRQGKSIEDTNTLLTDSIQLAKLSGQTSEETSSTLTATMNAFKMSAGQMTSVLDAEVALANSSHTTASVSIEQLNEMLSKSSNSAYQAGMGLNQLLAILATIETATQKDAGSIGQAMDTIMARFTQVKAGANLDDAGESLNNVEKTLDSFSIATRDATGDWLPFGEIIDSVASKWNSYNKVQQDEIATAAAGTRQKEDFVANKIPQHAVMCGNLYH